MTFDRNLQPDPTSYYENQGLKLTGPRKAKWKTTECKFHGGSDSMRVNTATGAWVCMSCGVKGGDVLAYEIAVTGADFVEAAKTIGAWVDDGKPHKPQKPTPLSPRAALSALAFECTFVAIAAGNIKKGVLLTDSDLSRLMTAAGRINLLAEAFT
jgi:phage/plasmid primase-like uncharacterized protein